MRVPVSAKLQLPNNSTEKRVIIVCLFVYLFVCLFMATKRQKTISNRLEERKEMFYLTTHSSHFIYSYIMSAVW